jgi:hypothetical protein
MGQRHHENGALRFDLSSATTLDGYKGAGESALHQQSALDIQSVQRTGAATPPNRCRRNV